MTQAQVTAQLLSAWPVFVVTLGTLFAVWRWGGLSRGALTLGPDRSVGLGPGDLLAGVGMLVMGASVWALIARGWIGVAPESGKLLVPSTTVGGAALVICGQLVQEGPVAAWFLVRAALAPRGLRRVGVVARRPWRDGGVALAGVCVAIPLMISVTVVASAIGALAGYSTPELAHKLLPVILESPAAARAVLAVAVVVVAPLLEESIFRGLLQSSLVEWWGRDRRWWAVAFAAAVFAAVHLSGGDVPPTALPGLFALALVLGWLYEHTGSLWPSILVHAMFNGFQLAMTLLFLHVHHGAAPQAV